MNDIEDILKDLEKKGLVERLPNGRWVATEKGRTFLTWVAPLYTPKE